VGACACAAEAQWKKLLDTPAKDTRTGKEKSTPMLAMIIAGQAPLLEILYKARLDDQTAG
jgi:hypothetical protein